MIGATKTFFGWLALTALFTTTTHAQTYRVTAGEHPEFTRIVVHTQPGVPWELLTNGPDRTLTVAPEAAQFDVSRLFARIPRTRLASADTQPGQLLMTLACNCSLNAWEDRPGLIVIDISDTAPDEEPMPSAPAPSQRPPVGLSLEAAQAAGETLAEAHAQAQALPAPAIEERPSLSAEAIAESLGLPIARALTQGVLEPAGAHQNTPANALLGSDHGQNNIPENMRIASVVDRPDPSAPPDEVPSEMCLGAEALDFLLVQRTEPFDAAFGRLTRALYGEFDQPDPQARLALIELYLSSGFGAEARALIANQPDPVAGRDVLLGMSDVLEDRNSNSRLRLAQMIGCSGPSALLAALAGAPHDDIANAATNIAMSFTEMDPALRAIIGRVLAQSLIESRALDAARIVSGSAQRSAWVNRDAFSVIDAQLNQARGHPIEAFARLSFEQASDPVTILAQLALALETGLPLDPEYLASAEALATTERGNEAGPDLMESVILLRARSGAFAAAFENIDNMAAWHPDSTSDLRRVSALRNSVWTSLAEHGDDLALMRNILNRTDWRTPQLDLPTRQALAGRLVDLGLAQPVFALLPDGSDPGSAELLARAYMVLGQHERVLDLTSQASTDQGRRAHAAALAALGRNEDASRAFENLGDHDDAQTAATLAGDWTNVQRLGEQDPTTTGANTAALGQVLDRRPGYLDQPSSPESIDPGTEAAQEAGPSSQPSPASPPIQPRQNAQQISEPAATPDGGDTAVLDIADNSTAELAIEEYSFDRLGLITQSATLLDESVRLRATLRQLLPEPAPD